MDEIFDKFWASFTAAIDHKIMHNLFHGDPQLPTLSEITIDDSGTPRTPKDDEKAT